MPKIIKRDDDEIVPARINIRHGARKAVKQLAANSDARTEDVYGVLIDFAVKLLAERGVTEISQIATIEKK